MMYNSPSSSYRSPGVVGSTLPNSPSDSRVPRTPNVDRKNVTLDQSVPLTPLGMSSSHLESPGLPSTRVPSTPDMPRVQWERTLTPSLTLNRSPQGQGISCSSTPSRLDQQVPSTPKNRNGAGRKSSSQATAAFMESLLSPVPHTSTAASCQELFDSLSPVQPLPATASPYNSSFSPSFNVTHTDEESGYLSSSFRRDDLDESGLGSKQAPPSFMQKAAFSSNSGQGSPNLPRKWPPPSRRKLSLCRQGQQETLRRTAHHNRAAKRSNSTSSTGSLRNSSASNDTLSTASAIIESPNTYMSLKESGFLHVAMEQRRSPKGLEKKPTIPLVSPAGDANVLLLSDTAVPSLENKGTKDVPSVSGNTHVVETGSATLRPTPSSTQDRSDGASNPKKETRTVLDLFDEDGIFD